MHSLVQKHVGSPKVISKNGIFVQQTPEKRIIKKPKCAKLNFRRIRFQITTILSLKYYYFHYYVYLFHVTTCNRYLIHNSYKVLSNLTFYSNSLSCTFFSFSLRNYVFFVSKVSFNIDAIRIVLFQNIVSGIFRQKLINIFQEAHIFFRFKLV